MWRAIVTFVLGLLNRWISRPPDAERDYQKRFKEWQDELDNLEAKEKDAANNWKAAVARGGLSNDLLRLQSEWAAVADALRHHRSRQPKRVSGRAE